MIDLKKWVHVKHISEISREDQERAFEARDEINQILETYFLLLPEEAKSQIIKVVELEKEIEKLGFFIDIRFPIKNEGEYLVLLAEIGLYTLKCKTETVN